jgi:hypothetical protein
MTDQPRRVTPAEISELLTAARLLPLDAPLDDQIAFHERKARLMSRIARDLDTADAYGTAADAWHQAGVLARQRNRETEARP